MQNLEGMSKIMNNNTKSELLQNKELNYVLKVIDVLKGLKCKEVISEADYNHL